MSDVRQVTSPLRNRFTTRLNGIFDSEIKKDLAELGDRWRFGTVGEWVIYGSNSGSSLNAGEFIDIEDFLEPGKSLDT